jgi:hypothetical protein
VGGHEKKVRPGGPGRAVRRRPVRAVLASREVLDFGLRLVIITSIVVQLPQSQHEGNAAMPQGQAVFLGLNQTGMIVFIVLLLVCLPLCWIPFLIDSMKGEP